MFPSGSHSAARLVLLAAVLMPVAGCMRTTAERWQSPVAQSHPAVGCVWDVGQHTCIGGDALVQRLARHRFILLGEKHDNPDHHRLQARIVRAVGRADARPAVAFEMLSTDVAPALEEAQVGSPSADDLRRAVGWDESGWPEWALYEPIFAAALDASLPIVAADLDRQTIERVRAGGLDAIAPERRRALGLDQPLSPIERRAMEEQIRTVHCGHAPQPMLDRMIDVQRARDAHLAHVLVTASGSEPAAGAILIAGTGHVRRDWGAPIHLRRRVSPTAFVSLAFLEVDAEESDPERLLDARYGASVPFDYIWFTPRVDDADPCERFREQLEKLRTPDTHSTG
jgi:uncharacterized iron-regulated protein